MKKRTKTLLGTLALVIVIGVALSSLICVIPPVAMTNSAIIASFVRINMFMSEHHRFPGSLKDLPKREGYANSTTDGWHRPLIYRVEKDNFITLLSLGEDGKRGGTGENSDIEKTYRTRNPDGSWCVDDEMWILTAEIGESPTKASTATNQAALRTD